MLGIARWPPVGVEVKAPRGKLRAEQSVFLARVRCAGDAFVVRDVLRELALL